MDTTGKTLSEVLAALGWKHEPAYIPSRQGRSVYQEDGTCVGVIEAHECWDMLRRLDLIK